MNIQHLKISLIDYLESKNSMSKFQSYKYINDDYIYGMNTYKVFLGYTIALSNKEVKFDIRPFHILWEHKLCMKYRIEYLIKVKKLPNLTPSYKAYEEIERKAHVIRNLSLKYKVSDREEILERILEIIKWIEKKEQVVIEKLIELL